MLPFTTEEFLQVFASYNHGIYPLQGALLLLALAAVLLALKPNHFSNSAIGAILSILWLWIGIVYHLFFFTRINGAAHLFAVLCVAQAMILFFSAIIIKRLKFQPKLDLTGAVGAVLVVYALIIYPVLNYLLGHAYPRAPTFGTPCPTTIFTLGLLLWARPPLFIFIGPLIWSFIGFTAALMLGITEDFALPVAGLLAMALIYREQHLNPAPERRSKN